MIYTSGSAGPGGAAAARSFASDRGGAKCTFMLETPAAGKVQIYTADPAAGHGKYIWFVDRDRIYCDMDNLDRNDTGDKVISVVLVKRNPVLATGHSDKAEDYEPVN